MMYLLGEVGQLGNQLFRLGHHVSNSLAYDYTLVCPSFQYADYFPNLGRHPKLKINTSKSEWKRQITKSFEKLAKSQLGSFLIEQSGGILLDDPYEFSELDLNIIEKARFKPVVVTNWLFRDYTNFKLQANSLRYLFQPNDLFMQEAKSIIGYNEKRPVIGVHIRRGDYRDWESGRYYYSDDIYSAFMRHILTLPGLEEAAFVICSNEEVDHRAFTDLEVIKSANNHFLTDLAILSCCDYIIGPPSTFSGWASFFGEVPLFHIINADKRITLADFAVSAG